MTRARRALTTLILGLAVLLGSAAAAPAGPCDDVPATVARTVENRTNSSCDAGCGALRNLGLSGPVPDGTGIRGGGQLRYVDQWHGECQISGGPLNSQCKAPTTCPPGQEKFQDGGVWKCRIRVTTQVPNPVRAECEAAAAAAAARAAAKAAATPPAPPASPALKQIASMIARGRPLGEIQAHWTAFLEGATKGGKAVDPNALIQWVLQESYKQQKEDLKLYADKVKHHNEVKAKLREEIQKGRQAQGGAPGSARQEADARLRQLEDKLSTVGDDAQLANLDLQNALQRQQQAVQAMSNVSKMMHDTAMAIIRNLRG